MESYRRKWHMMPAANRALARLHTRVWTWVASFAPAISACTGQTGVTQGQVFDSAGVRISHLEAPDRILEGVRYLHTGRIEAEEGAVLVERRAQVTTNGVDRVYLTEPTIPRVRVFTLGGQQAVELGREGGGPGEYRLPAFLRVGDSGMVYITDQARLRAIRFDSADRFVGETDLAELGFPHGPVVIRADTTVWLAREPSEWVLYRKTPDAPSALATIELATKGRLRFPCGDGTVTLSDPPMEFAPGLVWHERGGRLVVASEESYQVSVFVGGRLTHSLGRSIEPVASTAAHVRRAHPTGLTLEIGPRKCTIAAEDLAEVFGVMPSLPRISGLLQAPDGTLWVERFALPDEDPTVDIFDRDLRYIGSISDVGRPVGFLSEGRILSLVRTGDLGVYALAVLQGRPEQWE